MWFKSADRHTKLGELDTYNGQQKHLRHFWKMTLVWVWREEYFQGTQNRTLQLSVWMLMSPIVRVDVDVAQNCSLDNVITHFCFLVYIFKACGFYICHNYMTESCNYYMDISRLVWYWFYSVFRKSPNMSVLHVGGTKVCCCFPHLGMV